MDKFLKYTACVAIAAFVVAVGLSLLDISAKGTSVVDKKISTSTTNMLERKYTKYTDGELTGADVINGVREFKSDISVTVVTSTGTFTFDYNSGAFNNKPSDSNYINPSLTFVGEIVRDANDSIVNIIFTQK